MPQITRTLPRCAAILVLGTAATVVSAADIAPAAAPNGIVMPRDFADWRVVSLSHRSDKNQLRAILGNDAAIAAARTGKTNPWPDGAILAKVAWKNATDPHWAAATVPGEFAQVEFMVKDAKRFAATGGWGYARWVGNDLKPYGKDANFTQECVACHTPVKGNDYVFTHPAPFPAMTSRR